MSQVTGNAVEISVSRYTGERLKLTRTDRKASQARIGKTLDAAFQQFRKFERDENRIAAAQLFVDVKILNVEMGFFIGIRNIGIQPVLTDVDKSNQ